MRGDRRAHGQGRGCADRPGLAPSRHPCASCAAGMCAGTWGQRRSGRFLHSLPCCLVEGRGDSRVLTRSQSPCPRVPVLQCRDVGAALSWPVPKVPALPQVPALHWRDMGTALALAPSQGLSPSPGSCPALEGHGDSPFLPLFPAVPVLQISVGTWGQPFSAPLPKVPALPSVPAPCEVPVPYINVGTLGQPCPASLPDIPVPQIVRAQSCPCSLCVPDCPCPIAQCGDSPAN